MFDWITSLISTLGAPGVALLMFLENVFPPIPSELIMPLAGFNAARGEMSFILILTAGVIGSVAGALLWYWIGAALGPDRLRHLAEKHGRWLGVSPEEFDRARDWFDRHGRLAVLIGRFVPAVRTLISVPAGITGMPLGAFLAYSTLGTLGWTSILAGAGYLLESQYDRVAAWLNPVSTAIVIGLVALYFWRVATYARRTGKSDGH